MRKRQEQVHLLGGKVADDHVYGEHTYSMRNEKLKSRLLISHCVPISRNEKLYLGHYCNILYKMRKMKGAHKFNKNEKLKSKLLISHCVPISLNEK